jgi:hypothetical protein
MPTGSGGACSLWKDKKIPAMIISDTDGSQINIHSGNLMAITRELHVRYGDCGKHLSSSLRELRHLATVTRPQRVHGVGHP